MSLYLNQIAQLVALQRVDDEIYVIEQEMEKAPREVEGLRNDFANIQAEKSHLEDKMVHLREQAKRIDFDIDSDLDRISKGKDKLMQVGNAKEYHAMMREMDTLEKSNRTREEEKITLADELERQKAAMADVEERFAAMETDLKAKEESLDARLAEGEKKRKVLDKERAAAGQDIPAPVLARYEFIRQRLSHPVIVPVNTGVCSGCNISIPPQGYIELQRGSQILSCPNCQRLIYWSEHFKAE
ncbi:C4-type zinc ribbon domain-containing protein [Desulfovibrio sp. OttesenSCG-928-O18]|nr:C4-type zinc ribbon domain-containing protein [Desulfovibrio sp. OttesenSCG-928-O18]